MWLQLTYIGVDIKLISNNSGSDVFGSLQQFMSFVFVVVAVKKSQEILLSTDYKVARKL